MTSTSSNSRTKSKLALFSLAGFAFADQPVHCLKNDVLGDWKFHISHDSELPDLFNIQSVCSHQLPNKLQIIEAGHEFNLGSGYDTMHITLNEDFSCDSNGESCTWSMMYDQAFVIRLPGKELTANFRYEVKQGQESSWQNLQTGDYDNFWSHCGQTMMGVVRNTNTKEFSCLLGEQTHHRPEGTVTDDQTSVSMLNLAQTSSSASHHHHHGDMMFAQTDSQPVQLAQTKSRMRTLSDVPEDVRIAFAQRVNESDMPWKANSYSQLEMERLATRQDFGFAQIRTSSFDQIDQDILSEAQKHLHISNIEDITLSNEEMEHFDWKNFQGYDFTGEMRDQGSCGSCYMIATITMLESRIKLWYGQERKLSSQMPLQCNFLTEGCHGGWGLLSGIFLESYHTVADSFSPYSASTTENACSNFATAPKVASVDQVYYVGGSYGLMTEELLMKEIRGRGPVLYDFNAGYEFMTYNSGILTEALPAGCSSEELTDDSINTISQDDLGIEYQHLTHSTLVTGWGEEDGMKYWNVRNSYGGNWGESGYFRVRRGHNDFGGEGENAGVVPICHDCYGTRADLL